MPGSPLLALLLDNECVKRAPNVKRHNSKILYVRSIQTYDSSKQVEKRQNFIVACIICKIQSQQRIELQFILILYLLD